MKIRKAKLDDLDVIDYIESVCFPPSEAASKTEFKERLEVYPDFFWMLEDEGKVVGFINALASNEEHLKDEMYHNTGLHNPDGSWYMVVGVNTVPEYRNKGCAAMIMDRVIRDGKAEGRKGIVLTCKERLIPYYEKFGFVNEGISQSVHGGEVWYAMRLEF